MNPGLALPGSHDATILSAAGGVTNHAGLAINAVATAVAKYSLIYPDPNDVVLHYDINFSPAGLTINEHSVGNAVNAIQLGRNSPNFVPIAAALFYQPDVATLGKVYDSLSGEGTSGVEQTAFTANDLFMNAIRRETDFWISSETNDPHAIALAGETAMSYAAAKAEHPALTALKAERYRPHGWRVWTEAYGGGAFVGGEPVLGTARLNSVGGGLAAGADYQARPDTLFGVALGGGPSSFRVADRATSGSVDAGHVAAYGATRWDSFYASGIVGYDFFTNKVDRSAAIPGSSAPLVPVPGFTENLTGKFSSQSISARVEAGWKMISHSAVNVTPFAALQYSLLSMNGFTEISNGAPSVIGLSYAKRMVDSFPLFLGAQFDSKIITADGRPLSSWLRVAWMHEFEPYRTINPSFIAAPGYDFIINGAVAPRDAARVDAGWNFSVSRNVGLFTNIDGEFSGRGNAYSGSGGFRISW